MGSLGGEGLSILDLAVVGRSETVADALRGCVETAQIAETHGYERIWYAEHHSMPSIASAATAVLIGHVAAHTSHIRLGSGGVMLPNHPPLVIAEQFGTLASLHPGRIEIGLGRAPGSDQPTARALRRSPERERSFPDEVVELQSFLAERGSVDGVVAIPGQGTRVPLTVLGSSLFGAQLAAELGLPYAFASHFAPADLERAIRVYRDGFTPSPQAQAPCAYAAVNVVIADTHDDAHRRATEVLRRRIAHLLARGRELDDAALDGLVASPAGRQVAAMARHTVIGSQATICAQLDDFLTYAGADRLIVVFQALTQDQRTESVRLLAEARRTPAPGR